MNKYKVSHVLLFAEEFLNFYKEKYAESKKLYDEEVHRRKSRNKFLRFMSGSDYPYEYEYDFFYLGPRIDEIELLYKEAAYLIKIGTTEIYISNQNLREKFLEWCTRNNIPR